MDVKNNIIVAMDLMNILDSYDILEQVSDYINTIKIGYPLTLIEGLEAITAFKENFDFNIICDFKIADIPATNSKIAEITFKSGADYVICHGFVGRDSVEACQLKAKEYNKDIFLLTEMSHPGSKQFLQPVSDEIAKMGVEMGINNYVGPSTQPDRLKNIREIVGDKSFIISPGVGTQGGDPKKTLEYANALIIGRSIYEANNPEIAIKNIIDSIE